MNVAMRRCPHASPSMAARYPGGPCDICRGWIDADLTVMNAETARARYPQLSPLINQAAARWAPPPQPTMLQLLDKTIVEAFRVAKAILVVVVVGLVLYLLITLLIDIH